MPETASIALWPEGAPGMKPELPETEPVMDPYLLEGGEARPAFVVCPGGGYTGRAEHEGKPVAEWLNRLGISAFVCHYRVKPYQHPYPSMDAMRAIRLIRHRAEEWSIDPGRIGILGFSAGGHCASTVATHFDLGDPGAEDPVDRKSSRPDAAVLCYAVISFGEFRHQGSMRNLLGESPPEDLVDDLSNEKRVTAETPPTFLWHTADDAGVPVENSLLFALALRRHGVPFALHVYPHGRHGLGLASETPEVCGWTQSCAEWLKGIGF